jgi:hypothetical protein
MKNDLRTYFAQQRAAKITAEVVRESLAQTLVARLIALTVVLTVSAVLFFLVSPTVGFTAMAVGLFLI